LAKTLAVSDVFKLALRHFAVNPGAAVRCIWRIPSCCFASLRHCDQLTTGFRGVILIAIHQHIDNTMVISLFSEIAGVAAASAKTARNPSNGMVG
jgi:hypothetical protein